MVSLKGLYAVTPEYSDTSQLLRAVEQALRGGATAVQYRNKSDDVSLKHEQAAELLALCRQWHVPLIVNDDLRLAALIDADGVHLGESDPSLQEARIILGPDKFVGVSCYQDIQRAQLLAANGADYVAFGSFFASSSKPGARPCPLDILGIAREKLTVPVVAIGGITPDNAKQLVAAGADAVAVISALFHAPDVELAALALSSLFSTKH